MQPDQARPPGRRDRKVKYEFQSDQTGRSSILSQEMLGEAAVGRVNGKNHYITLCLSEQHLLSKWTGTTFVGNILGMTAWNLRHLYTQANEAMLHGRSEPFVEQMEANYSGIGVVLELSLLPEPGAFNLRLGSPDVAVLKHPRTALVQVAALLIAHLASRLLPKIGLWNLGSGRNIGFGMRGRWAQGPHCTEV